MRVSTASLIAGALILIAGLSGSSFAAEGPGRTAPSADVAAIGTAEGGEATGVETAPEETEPAGEDRPAPEVATEALAEEQPGEEASGFAEGSDQGRQGQDDQSDRKDPPKQPLAEKAVTIEDFEYDPDPIEVAPGDEITWTNRDTAQHTATAEGKGDFDTGLLEKGQRGTVPFNETGSFAYICTVHPDMTGKVIVRAAGDTGGGSGSTTDPTVPLSGSGGSNSSSGSSGECCLPETGQAQLPLILFGVLLLVIGLLARAFHEHWIWR